MKYDPATVKEWAGNSQWKACQADIARYKMCGYGSEASWALATLVLYRLQKIVGSRRRRWVWAPVRLGLRIVNYLLVTVTQIRIHPETEIGPGLLLPHVGPIRVIQHTEIGADCVILHTCTIGAGPKPDVATIGDHVFIGCHASIIGGVTIGDRATISANSLVISDVPAGATALGVPARILPGLAGPARPRGGPEFADLDVGRQPRLDDGALLARLHAPDRP
jgi:serine O-acetyltransferase